MTQYNLIRIKNNYNFTAIVMFKKVSGHSSGVLFISSGTYNTTVNIFVHIYFKNWPIIMHAHGRKADSKVTFLAITATFPSSEATMVTSFLCILPEIFYFHLYIFLTPTIMYYIHCSIPLFAGIGEGCILVHREPLILFCVCTVFHCVTGLEFI